MKKMNYLFGFPVGIYKINPSNYNKEKIVSDIIDKPNNRIITGPPFKINANKSILYSFMISIVY